MQAASPTVLIESFECAAGADRSRGIREDRSFLGPTAVTIVLADRQFDECRRQIVARVAPVKARVGHQDHESAEREGQNAEAENPMSDSDPPGMYARSLNHANPRGLTVRCKGTPVFGG